MLQHLLNNLHVFFTLVFGVDKDVIEVYYYKNVEFFCQDLIDITLKRGRYISQSKKYNLVLKMAIAGFEGNLLFVVFSDPHLIIDITQVKLSKTPSPA